MFEKKTCVALAVVLVLGLLSQAGSAVPIGDKNKICFKSDLTEDQVKAVEKAIKGIEGIESFEGKAGSSEASFCVKDKNSVKLSDLQKALKETKATIDTSKIPLSGKVTLFFKLGKKG